MNFQNQSKMPVVYEMCDVFVLPSKGPGETWGLAVNEAMASGKVVIVSDKCGCAPDLVNNGVNGYMFKSGSYQDLAEKMHQLINKDTCAVLGLKSSQLIRDFSFEKNCEAIEEIV